MTDTKYLIIEAEGRGKGLWKDSRYIGPFDTFEEAHNYRVMTYSIDDYLDIEIDVLTNPKKEQ